LNGWSAVVEGKDPNAVFVAESAQHGITGFCAVGPGQEEELPGQGEVGAIYCLDGYKGKGIGAALFRMGREHLRKSGFPAFYLWVLQDNPTVGFYRHMGGELSGKKKTVELGGKALTKVVYRWY
jgi:ribosomal protein S18 acetylase RimI-like enzyme